MDVIHALLHIEMSMGESTTWGKKRAKCEEGTKAGYVSSWVEGRL